MGATPAEGMGPMRRIAAQVRLREPWVAPRKKRKKIKRLVAVEQKRAA